MIMLVDVVLTFFVAIPKDIKIALNDDEDTPEIIPQPICPFQWLYLFISFWQHCYMINNEQ